MIVGMEPFPIIEGPPRAETPKSIPFKTIISNKRWIVCWPLYAKRAFVGNGSQNRVPIGGTPPP